MDREDTQEQQKDNLTDLAEAFDRWRAERKLGSKIPEKLWDRVCKLEPEYGFGAVAHACRLNYAQFRRRLGLPVPERRARNVARKGSCSAGTFLEVGSLQALSGGECCIEVEIPQRKMTIRLSGGSTVRAGELISGLWDLMG